MPDEFDFNKVVAEVIQTNLDKLFSTGTDAARGIRNTLRPKFEATYRRYLTRILQRYGQGKSFFVRSEAIPLYDFFVPLDLRTQHRTLRRPSALDLFRVAPHVIIEGSGGSGKSMMMRHFLLSGLKSAEKTPIFFELRHLGAKLDIKEGLLEVLQASGLESDVGFLESALKRGQFQILLDGFDEVPPTQRQAVAKQIRSLADAFPNNWIIVSSRPDSSLEGWDSFTRFHVAPLDLASAVELVSRVPFDDEIKKRFIKDMREQLFARHESFLSNPLLLSIMLLTYSDVAHIPHKLSTFYSQAYEALFHRHDALKGGFQRERRCALDIHDFGRAFAAFSLLTYDKREFSFPMTRALEVAEKAAVVSMLRFERQAFVEDSIQAVCLLVEDGMELTFAHRSFQEFFVARFIETAAPDVKARLVERFTAGYNTDSVIALLHELDPYVVERFYILPQLEKLRTRLGIVRGVRKTHYVRHLKLLYSDIRVGDPDNTSLISTISDVVLWDAEYFTFRRYGGWNRLPGNTRPERAKIARQFKDEFGANVPVSTKSVVENPRMLELLMSSNGTLGLKFLETLFTIENEIRARHNENRDSLDEVLATKPKSQPGAVAVT